MPANELALARSFYAWLAKIELNEDADFVDSRLPAQYPTKVEALREVTNQLAESLSGTKYEERAQYWNNLFSTFETNSETVLDEAFWQGMADFFLKLFRPLPKKDSTQVDPGDAWLIRKYKTMMLTMKNFHERALKTRAEWPSYNALEQKFREDDTVLVGRSMFGWDQPFDDELMYIKDRKRARWIAITMGIFANFNLIGFFSLPASKLADAILLASAYITLVFKKALGEQVVRANYPE